MAVLSESRSFRLCYRLTLLCFALIVVTGVHLFFFYRPSVADAWGINGVDDGMSVTRFVQRMHWWVSQLFMVLGLATAVTAVAAPVRQHELRPARLALFLLPVLAVVGSITGTMLAWDNLALYAVTVGEDLSGFVPIILDDRVRFVLIGGRMADTAQVIAVLALHVVGMAGLSVVALAMGRPGRRVVVPADDTDTRTDVPTRPI